MNILCSPKLYYIVSMSSEARPISPNSFSQAIEDLPAENLYSKAFEINNSIAHLERSNQALQEYSDSIKNDGTLAPDVRAGGDKDCLDAIRDNEVVIERQQERVRLIKAEVERRGQRWHEAEPKGPTKVTNGHVNGSGEENSTPSAPTAPVRLSDEELRRRMQERLAQDNDGEDQGMHL